MPSGFVRDAAVSCSQNGVNNSRAGGTCPSDPSTEAEGKLSVIYSLLEINPHPLGKVKAVVHKNMPQKNPPPEKQNDT